MRPAGRGLFRIFEAAPHVFTIHCICSADLLVCVRRTCVIAKMSLSTDVAAAAVVAVNDSAEVPPGMSYGTAGFRSHERNLDGIFLRMGMLAVLRAIQVGKVRSLRYLVLSSS